MEVWFHLNEEPQLRSQHTRRRTRKNLHPRSSEARQESFCPLDKDLSWKSANRQSCRREALAREQKLLRTIRGNLSDQDSVPSLFFCPKKSTIRRCQELHSSRSMVRQSGNPQRKSHFT